MADRMEFKEKLEDIVTTAINQGRRISMEEVEKFFEEDQLSKDQIQLVCGYLLSQKIAVSGIIQMPENTAEQEESAPALSEEEQAYLKEYLSDIRQMQPKDEKEERLAYFLPKVVDEAKKLHNCDIFIGDLIQEGNISLMMALEMYTDETAILEEVKAGIRASLEEQNETHRRDKKMVEKVTQLENALDELSQDLGRKVTIDELALQLGITEEQVEDILKLAGEDTEDGDEAEE